MKNPTTSRPALHCVILPFALSILSACTTGENQVEENRPPISSTIATEEIRFVPGAVEVRFKPEAIALTFRPNSLAKGMDRLKLTADEITTLDSLQLLAAYRLDSRLEIPSNESVKVISYGALFEWLHQPAPL